jgi:hypothetical protein
LSDQWIDSIGLTAHECWFRKATAYGDRRDWKRVVDYSKFPPVVALLLVNSLVVLNVGRDE